RFQGRDVPLVKVAGFAQKKESFVRLGVPLLILDVHTVLLDGLGGLFLCNDEVGIVVLGIQLDLFGHLQAFHGKDLRIIVPITGIEFLPPFFKGDIAIVQGVVLGVQRMPISVDKLVLLGGTGTKSESPRNCGNDKCVTKIQNYRWSCDNLNSKKLGLL